MRKLTLDDAFTLSAIIDKMNIQTDLNKLMDEAKLKGSGMQEYLGGQMALLLIKSAHKARVEFYELLSSLSGKTQEEIKNMGLKDIKNLFTELAKQEDIGSFFKSAVEEQK